MATRTNYHKGGYNAAAPAHNISEQWDNRTGLYKRWDANGVQIEQRSLTAAESTNLGADDAKDTADMNAATIQARASTALSSNATFLALAIPTNAQVLAQVKMLTRECSGLIRLLLGQLDDISDT